VRFRTSFRIIEGERVLPLHEFFCFAPFTLPMTEEQAAALPHARDPAGF